VILATDELQTLSDVLHDLDAHVAALRTLSAARSRLGGHGLRRP
jgi:hypothetical protein